MRLRRLVLGLAVATALAAVSAFAAGLNDTAQTLASGTRVVATCDPTPDDWTYGSFTKNANGQVTDVTISNIAATCRNGSLSLRLGDGVNVSSGGPSSITTCAATCSVAMPVSPPLYPAQITSAKAIVTGP